MGVLSVVWRGHGDGVTLVTAHRKQRTPTTTLCLLPSPPRTASATPVHIRSPIILRIYSSHSFLPPTTWAKQTLAGAIPTRPLSLRARLPRTLRRRNL